MTSSFHSQVILPNNFKATKFNEPKQKELAGLAKRKTTGIVRAESLPRDANILLGRFFLSIKDEVTEREAWKARFVVQGHKDKMKRSILHDISVVQQHSIKLLDGLASIFDFQIFFD